MPQKSRVRATCERAAEWALFLTGAAFVITYGDALWRRMVPLWPGGGYGFGAVAGFLLLTSWSVAGTAYRRARRLGAASGKAAGLWILSTVAWITGMWSTAAVLSLIPGRNGQLLGSLGQDKPMWAEEHPEVWGAIVLGLVAGAAVLASWRGRGRRRRHAEPRARA